MCLGIRKRRAFSGRTFGTGELLRTWRIRLYPLLSDSHPPTDLGVPPQRVGAESLLPRKEVIQPHLPVQLPCYDFVPVTSPTLGRCLPYGLAYGLQVLPASMT